MCGFNTIESPSNKSSTNSFVLYSSFDEEALIGSPGMRLSIEWGSPTVTREGFLSGVKNLLDISKDLQRDVAREYFRVYVKKEKKTQIELISQSLKQQGIFNSMFLKQHQPSNTARPTVCLGDVLVFIVVGIPYF